MTESRRGEKPTPEEIAEISNLRDHFSVKESLSRIDSFAKWIFTTVATVASISSGLTVFVAADSPRSVVFTTLSTLLLGVSLGLASVALIPRWEMVQPNSLESLRAAVDKGIASRRWPLSLSGLLLAAALILSGLSPYVARRLADPSLSVALVTEYNERRLELHGSGIPQGSKCLVIIHQGQERTPLASFDGFADSVFARELKLDPTISGALIEVTLDLPGNLEISKSLSVD